MKGVRRDDSMMRLARDAEKDERKVGLHADFCSLEGKRSQIHLNLRTWRRIL